MEHSERINKKIHELALEIVDVLEDLRENPKTDLTEDLDPEGEPYTNYDRLKHNLEFVMILFKALHGTYEDGYHNSEFRGVYFDNFKNYMILEEAIKFQGLFLELSDVDQQRVIKAITHALGYCTSYNIRGTWLEDWYDTKTTICEETIKNLEKGLNPEWEKAK